MILKNSLYTIEKNEAEGSGWRFDISLHADHLIYQSHFPGQPITPGACLIQMAKELLEERLSLSLRIIRIKDVKFVSVISPLETPHITFHYQKVSDVSAEGEVSATVSVADGERVFSSIVFTCKSC